MRKIECIIMDWAGTAVDFGCFAPVNAFIKAFSKLGIEVSEQEVRMPMGKAKIEHIRTMLQMDSINIQFTDKYARSWEESDVRTLNEFFEKELFSTLSEYTTPISSVVDLMQALREKGIRIGSTTGYTRAMLDVVQQGAALKNYRVDSSVTADEVPAGRPAPFMIFQNMINLNVKSLDSVVKVGDTIEDIKEGLSAKVWTVGIIKGSSELALSESQIEAISSDELAKKMSFVRSRMLEAGAHFVIDSIEELTQIINQINLKLEK